MEMTGTVYSVMIRYVFPSMQFGLTIGLDYKDFDLSILLQGQSGAKWRINNGFNSGANGNGLNMWPTTVFHWTNTNANSR